MRDAVSLLRPALVLDEAHSPHLTALRALGDLHTLFQARAHVAHKITFYAASLDVHVRAAVSELQREAQMREVSMEKGREQVGWERVGSSGQEARKVEIVEIEQ